MKQKDIIVLIAVAAGGYLLYSYLKDQNMLPEWLGGEPKPDGSAKPATETKPSNENGSETGGGNDKPTDDVPKAITAAELTALAKDNPYLQDGKMNAHQWNYYRNIARPPALSGEEFGAAFPGDSANNLMTVDEFLSALKGQGLAAIVPAQAVPSMTFGGNLGSYGMPMRRRNGWVQ